MTLLKKTQQINKKLPKIFNPVIIPETIKRQLIKLGAFKGEYRQRTHFSHIPYLLGFKNNYIFYNINQSILLFSNALSFLKRASINPKTQFILIGTPIGQSFSSTVFLNNIQLNHIFYPNEQWESGIISKRLQTSNLVLIIFNLTLNNTAYREGINAKIPIVGFATSYCDIRGLDYPVLINLKNQSIWYIKLILALFYTSK